jgi:hypothetical protein
MAGLAATVAGAAVVVLLIVQGGGKENPPPKKRKPDQAGPFNPSPIAARPPTRNGSMEAFFKKEKALGPPALTADRLEALAGTWEARYASFYLGAAPVEVKGLPAFRFVIQKTARGMVLRPLDQRLPARALTIAGGWIRGARLAGKPDLSLRIAGKKIIGLVVGKAGKQSLHAEFQGVRR